MNDEANFTIDGSTIITSSSTVDISTVDVGTIWFNTNDTQIYINDGTNWNNSYCVEWKNCFPNFEQVEEMCKEYPSLEKAYENFRTIYKMVEQDWVGKQKEKYSST